MSGSVWYEGPKGKVPYNLHPPKNDKADICPRHGEETYVTEDGQERCFFCSRLIKE